MCRTGEARRLIQLNDGAVDRGYLPCARIVTRPIARVSSHGISLGIYFGDPDGNGIA
jgi:hypothetical protein